MDREHTNSKQLEQIWKHHHRKKIPNARASQIVNTETGKNTQKTEKPKTSPEMENIQKIT